MNKVLLCAQPPELFFPERISVKMIMKVNLIVFISFIIALLWQKTIDTAASDGNFLCIYTF